MLQYSRIDISEGIDVNNTSASKECDICHYWYFKDVGFKYKVSLQWLSQFNAKSYEF